MYKIKGKYQGGAWDEIDEFDSKVEADAMLREYAMAYGPGWQLKVVRGRSSK